MIDDISKEKAIAFAKNLFNQDIDKITEEVQEFAKNVAVLTENIHTLYKDLSVPARRLGNIAFMTRLEVCNQPVTECVLGPQDDVMSCLENLTSSVEGGKEDK